MKILALGAHPDDIEIFMFGLLAKYKKLGHTLSLLIATDGSLGGKNLDRNLAQKRKKESITGLKSLGTPSFLNLPDGSLGSELKHEQILKDEIQNINPDLIITHYKHDYHSDHIKLSYLVKSIASHYTPILYCDTMMGINFNPNYYVDITEFMDMKLKSILKHSSQKPKRFVKLIKLMNSYRSAQCNAPTGNFAEAYLFENSFPYADIRDILPPSSKLYPFHIQNINGFL